MGIGIWQLVIILLIVLLLFGAKRLRNIGSDLGSAVKGFKSAVKDEENASKDKEDDSAKLESSEEGHTIEGEASKVKDQDKT